MHPLSLAAGVLPDCSPLQTAEAAVAAGFDMAGVWAADGWTPATTRAVRTALGGMPVLDVEYIHLTPGPLDDAVFRLIDVAADLGAANVLLISSDPDDGATAAKLAHLAAYAAERRVRVALEFGIFTSVGGLAQALRIVNAASHPAAALLLDPIHLDRAGVPMAALASIPRERLTYAQFCDAPAVRPDPRDHGQVLRDALDLRELPGRGVLPLADFLTGLPADLPLSVELRSAALRRRHPDALGRAQAVANATRAWLANLADGSPQAEPGSLPKEGSAA